MFSIVMKAPLIMVIFVMVSKAESGLRSAAAEEFLTEGVSARGAKADFLITEYDGSCMVDADCTFNPFPAAKMTCCTSGRDFKTCHFICNAMIRSEFGKGNLINHVTATIGQGEKGQNDMVNGITIAEEIGQGNMVNGITIAEEIGQGNMVNGITIAEEVGKGNMVGGVTIAEVGQGNMVGGVTIAEVGQGNMVGGVTIAEVGQGNMAGGNMVNGITVPGVGQGNLVSRMTATIGQGEKGQNDMVNGITIAEEIGQGNLVNGITIAETGKGNMVNGVTIPTTNTRRTPSASSSSPAVDGHEPVARVRVQSDYTLGRYKSILSDMMYSGPVIVPLENESLVDDSGAEEDYEIIALDGKGGKGKKGDKKGGNGNGNGNGNGKGK